MKAYHIILIMLYLNLILYFMFFVTEGNLYILEWDKVTRGHFSLMFFLINTTIPCLLFMIKDS